MKTSIAKTTYRSMPAVLLLGPAILNPFPTVRANSEGSFSGSFGVGIPPTVLGAAFFSLSLLTVINGETTLDNPCGAAMVTHDRWTDWWNRDKSISDRLTPMPPRSKISRIHYQD